MIIAILLMHVIFFINCSEYILPPLPNDILNIFFMDIQNEKVYKNINRQKFFNYVHSSSDKPYNVAFPVLAQTNRSLYSHFADYLQLECTITYLKNNILTNIYLIDKQQKILFPLEKITCFFSDIPLGQKDIIQFSTGELADWHLEKYSPSNIDALTNCFENIKTAYSNIPTSLKYQNLDYLNTTKSDLQADVNLLTETINGIVNELPATTNQFIYIKEALKEFLTQKDILLNQKKISLKDMAFAVETGHIFNTLAQGILKEKYKSNISFTQLYGKLQKKQKNRDLKIENQKTTLLKLLIIQMFAPHLNTNTHKDMLRPILADAPYQMNNDALKELIELIFRLKNNKVTSCENAWNKIYSTFWSEENFKNLVVHYISKMLITCTGLGLPYLPIIDNKLDIDLSDKSFFSYYKRLGLFEGKIPSMFLQNITTNCSVSNETFNSACSLFGTTSFNIPIKFNFLEPFFISNGVLLINKNHHCKYILENLIWLYDQNIFLYESIMKNVKIVNIAEASIVFNGLLPYVNFIKNLPEAIEIQLSFLKDCVQNKTLTINKDVSNSYTLRLLESFVYFNNTILNNSIFKHIHSINLNLPEDCIKDLNKDTISFITTFLRKKAKKDNELPMNSTLLSLLKYKDTETFKPLFEDINTIVCHASTIKELANIMNQWFLATHSENTQNNMQLKIVVASETIKKDFENSLYLTVFNSTVANSLTDRPLFVFNDKTLKESYIFFMPKELMYTIYTLTPHIISFIFFLGILGMLDDNLDSLDQPRSCTNVEMIEIISYFVNSTFCIMNSIIDYSPNTKIWLISKLILYILVSKLVYASIFIDRSWLLTSIIALILIDYHHINKSSLFFNLMHAGIQTIKNRSCKPTNVHIEVEQDLIPKHSF